ncbi:MAG: cell division protein FtsW [Acidobacteria bacterium]|nr:MAG: cell division protein FtsW [Acidobacteriota bacterium]
MARKLAFDRLLCAAVMLLVGLGLVMVYSTTSVLLERDGRRDRSAAPNHRLETGGSSSEHQAPRARAGAPAELINPYFLKQAVAAVLGIAGMLIVMHLDYRLLRKPAVLYPLVLAVLALLVVVLFARDLNNTRRWFFVGGVSIQPSELAKLALVPYVAYHVYRKRDRMNSYAVLLPCSFLTALMAALICMGQDLDTAVLLTVPTFVIVFLAGLSWQLLALGALTLLPTVVTMVMVTPYRLERFFAFLNPESDPQGAGYQSLQSLIAVGSGGVTGLGPGNSVQKLHFLPSPHADFVFAIVAEELGLIGALLVVALFAVVLWRGIRAGVNAPDDFGAYLAWGFTSVLVVQALVHVSVALSLMPVVGVPLPFISHGGSSLVTSLIAAGWVLNVSQHG